MGCFHSRGQQEQAEVGAPRPKKDSSDEVEGYSRTREFQLSLCVEAGSVPKDVQTTIAQQLRTYSDTSDGTVEKQSSAFTPCGSTACSRPLSSCNSQLDYANPDQTIIILDWDDTLCPSTCIRRHAKFDQKGRFAVKLDQKIRAELNMLADQVLQLMRDVQTLGKVVIVTNAKRPWVNISCNNFLPSVKGCLKNVPIIYALELIKECGSDKSKGLLTETKARAMKAAVTEFYSRYPRQSWKNIISVGDAEFEHMAIRQVVDKRPMEEKCRTKTIKLLESPTIAGMVVQLSLVKSWMTKIVQIDGDIDIDLAADEETVNNWVTLFGETK